MSTWLGEDVSVLLNQGHRKFGSLQHFPLSDQNWQIQVVDLNGDGKLDVVSSSETYSLTVMLNTTP